MIERRDSDAITRSKMASAASKEGAFAKISKRSNPVLRDLSTKYPSEPPRALSATCS